MGHVMFSFQLPFTIMLLNGVEFEGTYAYLLTDRRLKKLTGASNASCITQFRPVVFPHARMIYKLLQLAQLSPVLFSDGGVVAVCRR